MPSQYRDRLKGFAYHSLLALQAAFTKPGRSLLAEPCTVYRPRPRPLFLPPHCLFPSRPCSLHHFLPAPPWPRSLLSHVGHVSCLQPRPSFTSIGRGRASGRRRRWLKPLVLAAADEVSDGSSLDGRRERNGERESNEKTREGNGRLRRQAAWGLLCLCNDKQLHKNMGSLK